MRSLHSGVGAAVPLTAAQAYSKGVTSCRGASLTDPFEPSTEHAAIREGVATRLYQAAPISTNLILSFQAERALGLPKSY